MVFHSRDQSRHLPPGKHALDVIMCRDDVMMSCFFFLARAKCENYCLSCASSCRHTFPVSEENNQAESSTSLTLLFAGHIAVLCIGLCSTVLRKHGKAGTHAV